MPTSSRSQHRQSSRLMCVSKLVSLDSSYIMGVTLQRPNRTFTRSPFIYNTAIIVRSNTHTHTSIKACFTKC